MSFDRDRASHVKVQRHLSLMQQLFRSDARLTMRCCTMRKLDGHLRLEKKD
jgi:hypothetical protein